MSAIEDINNLIILIRKFKNKIIIIENAIKDSENQEILKDIDELIKFIPICKNIKDNYAKIEDDNVLLQSENKNLNEEVKDRINEIVKLKNTNEDLNKKIESQHEETVSLLKDYETIECMIDKLTKQCSEMKEIIIKKNEEIGDKDIMIKNMMKKIDELSEVLKTKDYELNDITEKLGYKLKELIDKNIEITQKANKIDELNDMIISGADDYVLMKAKYNETYVALEKVQELNKKKDDIIEELRNITELLEKERNGLKDKIEYKMKEIRLMDEEITKLTKHKCHIL